MCKTNKTIRREGGMPVLHREQWISKFLLLGRNGNHNNK